MKHLRIVLLMLLCSIAGLRSAEAAASRPNVLFIICDDLNDWALHPSGHPRAKTPNMDRLRKRSVNFTNAHVVVPVCGPSRKSLFSGMYPQTLDNYDFARWRSVPALKGCVPLPLHFRNNGYNTYGTGKLLHEGAGGDFYTAYGIAPDYGPWPWTGKGRPSNTPHPAQYETWIKHLPIQMHRDLNYGPLSNVPHWKKQALKGIPGAKGWRYENGKPFRYTNDDDRDKTPDEVSADWAIDILKKKHDRPFYLGVGFIRPHTPLYAPQKYFDLFPLEQIKLPPYRKDDLDDCASVLRDRWQWGYRKYDALIKAGGDQAWKEWVQAYLACTAFVDDQVGEVLRALDASPYRGNTIVVLTSDHGYHVGEKNCIQKWHLWDESTRVPLFIHVPESRGNGRTCNHPVSLIDMYPTLVDLCGLPKDPNKGRSNKPLDGHSLRPQLDDPEREEWNGPPVAFMGIRDGKANPHFSVRSRRYRYTLCGNSEEELYDHENDPNEWTNLADKPNHAETKTRLRGELMAILRVTRIPVGFGEDRGIAGALVFDAATTTSAAPRQYIDGRPAPTLRMNAKDHGIVLRYGDGPNRCDYLGARDVWVFKADDSYYMHYDAAGPEGWLTSLAVSKDLVTWEKKGPILDLGKPGEDDSKSAAYGVTYYDGKEWHMFYLGTPNVTAPPNLIPGFPYLTLKAKGSSPAGPWVKQKSVVPFRTKPGTYYSITASPGQVIKNGDEYLQFFSATTRKPGNSCVQRTLGIARTKDLDGPWTVDPNPMVPIEEQIENSSLYYEKSIKTWFLFTNHIGIDRGEYTDAIWVYWSNDLNKWDPANKAVVLDGQNCTWSKKCIGLPSVVQVGKRLALFYDAPEGNSTSHMRRHIGLAWLNLPLSLPGENE